jgi:hypothetical protein
MSHQKMSRMRYAIHIIISAVAMLIFAHGIFVDRDGNVWVTDGQDNAPQSAGGGAPAAGATKGHQVYKLDCHGCRPISNL